jgi:hypothetical protein
MRKGDFTSQLSPGKFAISIWSPGFVTFKKRNINVKADRGFEVTVVMQVGTTGGAPYFLRPQNRKPLLNQDRSNT